MKSFIFIWKMIALELKEHFFNFLYHTILKYLFYVLKRCENNYYTVFIPLSQNNAVN